MVEHIGFVGVGLMGHGMAANILKGGYPVTVIAHRNRAPVEDLVARGAAEAGSLADLAGASDVVFVCAPGSPVCARRAGCGPIGRASCRAWTSAMRRCLLFM